MEGRVELCLDGVWGTICDNAWTDFDATVVCHQLGYSRTGESCQHCNFSLSVCMPFLFSVYLSVSGKCHLYSAGLVDARSRRRAAFGQGTGAIHLDTFYCFGEEDRITDCIHRRATQCTHAQDAGVVCTAGTCTVH